MKNKLQFLTILGLTLLSSCSSYQIGTLKIAENSSKDKFNSFISENDSVKITYSFKGIYAPLEITIENKLNEPIYMNWEKSALIFKDDSRSLSGNDIYIKGNIIGQISQPSPQSDLIIADVNQSVNLSSPKPLTISFVAPKAIVKKKTISLNKKAENKVPKSSWKYSKVNYDDGVTATKKVKTAKFNTDNSPYKFRSYLTVYTATKDDKIKDVLNFEKSFYLAEIRNSGKLPVKVMHYKNSKGDMFYSPK